MTHSRRQFAKRAGAATFAAAVMMTGTIPRAFATPAEMPEVQVYRSPNCNCCLKWADHLRENGFSVKVENRDDLAEIKAKYGVPQDLQSCHTARVGGYTIEGHVSAQDIRKLLDTKPDARGLAVPGMPLGSPGMEHPFRKHSYNVVLFGETSRLVFAQH